MMARPLTTARGENTSAAWGVVNFLQRLQNSYHPDYIAWVHDSGFSFRHEVFPEYKATRQKLTEELQDDFDRGIYRIEQLLAAYRIPIVTVQGYEADDVIGTLAAQALAQDVQVVIVSGDKDFHQLLRPGVWLLNPGRGGSAGVEEHWVGIENAEERLGVSPEHVTDFLALVGDSSDNVPGVPGIGDKTAKDLVQAYGDLDAILSAAPAVTGKRPREALLAFPEQARLSKRLVTIRADVPATLDLESLRAAAPDAARLRQLFLELEFSTLLRDLEKLEATPPVQEKARYAIVDSVADLQRLVARARETHRIAFQAFTVPDSISASPADPLRSRLVGIAIAVAPGEASYLPLGHRELYPEQTELLPGMARQSRDDGKSEPLLKTARTRRKSPLPPEPESVAAKMLAEKRTAPRNLPEITSEEMRPLALLLAEPMIAKVTQNAKFDLLVMRRHGIELAGIELDTMLASYLLDPGRRSHGLELLSLEFLDYSMMSYESLSGRGKNEIPFDAIPVEGALAYAAEIADMSLRLRDSFAPLLEAQGLSALLREIEMPLVQVLADMEQTGICIDIAWFQSLKTRFQAERRRVESAIYAEAGETFNINSNQQLRTILFEKLKLPVRKRTPTGPSTDASVLQELADEGHALPLLMMEYRELAKLESTYLDTLPALVHPEDGRLHTSFNQTVAATGRLSSSDPNLQNIPIRRELGRDIRRGFVAQPGWQLVVADYSQVELRLLAHLARDPAFLEAFSSGGDIHRQTAALIFNVQAVDVTAEMRARAKTINFATIYGQGANALARQLKIPPSEARDFIATYFERFSGIRQYLDSQVAFARENGYVETIFKRRRYVPELRDRNFSIRAFGERVATNAPIQGSAADLIKIAMIRIHGALRRNSHRARMLLQVHDELVFECPEGELDEVTALVKTEMETAAELAVPIVVDIGVGPNWLEATA
jgi:DNA polymerase-1